MVTGGASRRAYRQLDGKGTMSNVADDTLDCILSKSVTRREVGEHHLRGNWPHGPSSHAERGRTEERLPCQTGGSTRVRWEVLPSGHACAGWWCNWTGVGGEYNTSGGNMGFRSSRPAMPGQGEGYGCRISICGFPSPSPKPSPAIEAVRLGPWEKEARQWTGKARGNDRMLNNLCRHGQ